MLPRAVAVAFVAVLGCSKSDPTPAPAPAAPAPASSTVHKDPAAAKDLIAKGAVVIDVRTPDEFAGGHVPNAVNLPVQAFGAHLGDVDKLVASDHTKPVVVYCAGGRRAAKAKAELDAAGYTNVVNGGGFDDLR